MAPSAMSAYTDSGVAQGSTNAFADAISQFIDELRDEEDKKSRFYKEVMVTACWLRMSPEPSDQSLVSADELSRFVKELESHHRKKSFTRRVFKSLQPLVDGLLQYTNAVDTMIQADPTAGALIYGGAKLVLQLASGYSRYFEKISEMMADIGDSLMCFHIYSTEFAANEKMNSILVRSYKDILSFWREASKILDQRGGVRIFVGGLLTPFEASYSKFKEKLDRNTRLVDSVAQALNIQDQGNFRRAHAIENVAAQEVIKSLERASSFPREEQGQTTTKHEDIRRWIAGGRSSRIDPVNDLERHLASRHIGTCEWVFLDPVFNRWRTSSKNDILWLNAAPGAGKSVLSSTIIDRLKDSDKKEHRNVLYFYCRFDDPDKCRAISVLRSIALQALKLIKYIPDELYQLYREEYSGDDQYVATTPIAGKVVEFLLKRIEYVYIVVDGLCECQDGTLVDLLIRLANNKGLGITKWLFTSRNELEICKKFQAIGADTLTVSKTVIEKDIRKYLEDNVDLLFGTEDQLDRLSTLSEGNFLSIRLTIDPLREEEVTCEEEFEETLKAFQPELGRCWYRSLKNLTRRKATIQELARTIFSTVALATQPMTFNELVDLLSIEIDQEPSPGRQRKKTIILSACTPFVELDDGDNYLNPTVRMAHKTVGEFLSLDPATLDFVDQGCHKFFVKVEEGNLELGKKCLTYLSYKRYSSPEDLTVLAGFHKMTEQHPFLIYAALFWYQHLDRHGGSRELYERVRDFLWTPNFWTCIRVQSKYAPHLFARLSYNCKNDSYEMHSPDAPSQGDDPEHDYYADALPTWLDEYENIADNLVWGYHMFVREWAEILIRRPEYIQCYFAKVLGQRSFWSTKQCSTDAVQIYPIEDFRILRQMMLFKIEGHASKKVSKCWFDLSSEGVMASFAILNEIPKHPIIVLEDWQMDLRSNSNREVLARLTHFDHVHLRRMDTPVAIRTNMPFPLPSNLTCLGLNDNDFKAEENVGEKPVDDLPLWIVEAGHPALPDVNDIPKGDGPQSCKIPENQGLKTVSKVLIGDVLEERLWSVYERAQKGGKVSEEFTFPTTLKDIQILLKSHNHDETFGFCNKQSVVEGELVATLYTLRARKPSSDATEDSDGDSDTESGEEPVAGELTMLILSIAKGEDEPHWYHHIARLQVGKNWLPFIDKKKACLLWPSQKSSVFFVDLNTWRTSTITLPNHKYKKHYLVAQSYHFSSESGILQQASIHVTNTTPFITITQDFLNFAYTAGDPTTAKITATSQSVQEATWHAPRTGFYLNRPFTWLDDILYVALGSFEMTILRFPPPPTTSPGLASLSILSQRTNVEPKIQSLPKPICIPATAHTRDLHFFIQLDPSTSKPHAIFCLNAMPVLELPPVVMDFDMERLCGPWEEYRLSREDRLAASSDTSFMKGMYAAKDQAFSVPIRSGLEWRKSTYVTCW